MTEHEITIGVPDMTLQPPFEGDRCIMDVYLEYVMQNMSSESKNELKLYNRGVIDSMTGENAKIKKKSGKTMKYESMKKKNFEPFWGNFRFRAISEMDYIEKYGIFSVSFVLG